MATLLRQEYDIIVVGAGNAGYCAAISAAERLGMNSRRRVLVIDKCPQEWAGGNTYYTAGAMRTVHGGLQDIELLVNNLEDGLVHSVDLDPYTEDDFLSDLHRVTGGRYDRALGQTLVCESNDTIKWLASHGVRFQLSFNRQAYKIGDRYKFWGGMCLKTQDGGKGLVEDHQRSCARLAIEVRHSTAAKHIHSDPNTGAFSSLTVQTPTGEAKIGAKALILAAGGFEANPRMRAQYLGAGWDLVTRGYQPPRGIVNKKNLTGIGHV